MSQPPSAYAFPPHEKDIHGFGFVLDTIAAQVRGLTRRSRVPLPETIHECRLLIKRIRALLWFARTALKASAFPDIKRELRKAAHLLAAERDRIVTQMTVKKIAQKTSKRRDREALTRTARSLLQNRTKFRAVGDRLRNALTEAESTLLRSIEELREKIGAYKWPSTTRRIKKARRSMRHARRKALHSREATAFHTWRKKTKRFLYLMELNHNKPHKSSARDIKKANRLQEKLGVHHDYVVAAEHLRRKDSPPLSFLHTLHILEKRRARLEKKLGRFSF